MGARHIGMLHSLIVTCRLHHVNPCDYLVYVYSESPCPRTFAKP